MMGEVRLTQVQMVVTDDKADNLKRASTLIDRAAAQGAEIVCLPEMFTTPYDNDFFCGLQNSKRGPRQRCCPKQL